MFSLFKFCCSIVLNDFMLWYLDADSSPLNEKHFLLDWAENEQNLGMPTIVPHALTSELSSPPLLSHKCSSYPTNGSIGFAEKFQKIWFNRKSKSCHFGSSNLFPKSQGAVQVRSCQSPHHGYAFPAILVIEIVAFGQLNVETPETKGPYEWTGNQAIYRP